MGPIGEPHLYEAVNHAMTRRIQDGSAPTIMLFTDSGLVRAVKAEHLKFKNTNDFNPKSVPQNLCPRDSGSNDNRFSGLGPRGCTSQRGGLYTSRHTSSMIAEILHYASRRSEIPIVDGFPDYNTSMRDRGVIQMRIVKPMLIVDLSRYASETAPFLTALEHDVDVRAALKHSRYRGAHLQQALFDGADYSVARGIGNAVANDYRFDGLRAGTARPSDREGETGDNVVLYGPDLQPVPSVRAEKVTFFDPITSDPRTIRIQ